MKTPKTLIVCNSIHHGNTLKVAQAMADVFDARILRPEEVDPAGLGDFDLIGLGSGIYFGRAHPAIRQLVLALARPGNAPKCVFLFSTSGIPFLSWLWHRPLKRQLERAGSAIVGEFSCRGWDTVGPLRLLGGINRCHPDLHDLERARRFAYAISLKALRQAPRDDVDVFAGHANDL